MLLPGTPAAGLNYTAIDGAVSSQWWPEYWVQGTATSTAGNFTWQADTWSDLMAAFKPASTGSGTFTITASPSSMSVAQGNQGSSTITTAVSGGFNNSISLSALECLPEPAWPSIQPVLGRPERQLDHDGDRGSKHACGNLPHHDHRQRRWCSADHLCVADRHRRCKLLDFGFTVFAKRDAGIARDFDVNHHISGGFNGAISLSSSGVPSGTTVSFNPATIPAPGSGTSVMTITVGSTTHMGTYPITVTATSGSTQQTTTINLTVTAQVALSWAASQGAVGYNVYRSTTSGSGYSRINTSLDPGTSYNDQGVQDGTTYYYVTTAVNSQGQESSYSNQASATVP